MWFKPFSTGISRLLLEVDYWRLKPWFSQVLGGGLSVFISEENNNSNNNNSCSIILIFR